MKISNNMKLGLGVAAIAALVIILSKTARSKVQMEVKKITTPNTDSNTVSFATSGYNNYVVGGYNASMGGTYVYPVGNVSGGYFVQGNLGLAPGTQFRPA